MAKQTIDLGSSPNKGDGDPLRIAFDKINDNFDELYQVSASISSAQTTSTDPVVLFTFSTLTYGSAKLVVQATRDPDRHTSEILVTHDGTTAFISETGAVTTNGILYTLSVDIVSEEVRVLTTSNAATLTNYTVEQTVYAV